VDNSSTGSRRSGDGQDQPREATPRERVRCKVGVVIGYVTRATDATERDDANRIDWRYVRQQLYLANCYLIEAMEFAEKESEQQSDEPSTADMLDIADEVDLVIDKHAKTPAEGGAS